MTATLVSADVRASADVDWPEEERAARDRASGQLPEIATKRSLVAVSHAIEKAVLAGPVQDPTVVVALLQRLA